MLSRGARARGGFQRCFGLTWRGGIKLSFWVLLGKGESET
jgi:hypothetical protein